MSKVLRIMRLVVILALFSGAVLVNPKTATQAAPASEVKVFLDVKEFGETGLDLDEIKSTFIKTVEEKANSGIVFTDSKGEGIKELELIVLQDDKDDDDDGIADAADTDDEGDGIEDSKENILTVDVDKQIPGAVENLPNENKENGLMVILSLQNSNGEIREAKLVTAGDSFGDDFEQFLAETEVWMFIRVGFME